MSLEAMTGRAKLIYVHRMEATKSADVSPDEQLGDLLGGFVGTHCSMS